MKIWLHFRDLMKPHVRKVRKRDTGEEFCNMQEIVDVELALPDTPKMLMIRNMEELMGNINELRQKMHAGGFKGSELFQK